MFIYAGGATVFVRDLGDIRTLGNAFALVITLVFFGVNRVKITKSLFSAYAVFLAYAAVTSIRNGLVNPHWISEWLIWLTMAYGISKCFKEQLFAVVETVLYHLCILSVLFWIVHLLSPDLMQSVVKALEFSKPYAEDDNVWANMILYTIDSETVNVGEYSLLLRNAGFAWEPGAFACFACLGLFCTILRAGFNPRSLSLWVFLMAIFSSQSTTGIMILLVMIAVWLIINKKYSYLFFLIPVLIMVFNLPFVKDKLFEEIGNLEYNDETLARGAVGRLFSLQLCFDEFLRHPLIGLGGYAEGTWLAMNGFEIATISGIGNMLVYFGAVMTVLFIYLLVKSCRYIQELFESRYAWGLMVVILGMMVSYGIWQQPIYIAFWMFGVFGLDYSSVEESSEEEQEEEPEVN